MDRTDPAVLEALFGLPPAEAIAHLKSKGLAITFNWAEMLDEAHARSFTVAKAMRLDVLRVLRKGVLDAIEQGKTLRQFETELTPLLQQQGWWGKQIVVDNEGQAQEVQLGSPRRLKTIYQTNLQSAYMAGRMKAQMEATAFPWLMYVAIMDGRTRPSHAALNGRIWRKDDPVWASIYPPNGFNCRCRTRALTDGQMRREGLSPSSPPVVKTREVNVGTDPLTGEQFRTVQTGVRVQDDRGRPITMWVDPGFNSSPLASHVMDELLAQKAIDTLGDAAAFDLVRQAVLSETRLKAWRAFVDNTLDSGITSRAGRPVPQGQTMTVGMLPLDVVNAMSAAGRRFSPVMYVEDSLVVGRKAARHEMAGDALSNAEWRSLPESLPSSTVYFEKGSGNLILVWEGDQSTAFKAAIDRTGKVDTSFRVSHESIESAVRSGQWKPV
jgi:SPP1 gp7 family putative phage head morphogenesis protein